MPNINRISVFLLCNNEKDFDCRNYIKDDIKVKTIDLGDKGILYIKNDDSTEPDWVKFFNGYEKIVALKLKSKAVSAVLISSIRDGEDTIRFALCSGNGRYLLKDKSKVEGFGLIAAKNALDPQKISGLDITSFEAVLKNKKIQASSQVSISGYALDRGNDVLKAIYGKTRDLGKGYETVSSRMVSGRDSLNLSAKVDIENLSGFLSEVYYWYKQKTDDGVSYNSHLVITHDSDHISKLDNELINQLNANDDRLFLFIPEIFNEQEIAYFGFPGKKNNDQYLDVNELSIPEGLKNVNQIKELSLKSYADDGKELESWRLYDCIVTEIELVIDGKNKYFVLQGGQYFEVDRSFREEVLQYYDETVIAKNPVLKPRVKVKKKGIDKWQSEGEYNDNQKTDSILVMDRKLINLRGQDKIELCDLLTTDKELLHVKINGSSSTLGHLFNQGLVSALALSNNMTDKIVNDKITEQAKSEGKDPARFTIKYPVKDYSIIFTILCESNQVDKNQRPIIPFLGKAVFMNVGQQLVARGFKVFLRAEQY